MLKSISMSAACLAAVSHAINIEEQLKPSKIFAQQFETADPGVVTLDVVDNEEDLVIDTIAGEPGMSGYGSHYGCSSCQHECDCPHLKDCVITAPEGAGVGSIVDTYDEETHLSVGSMDTIRDRETCHATATNTCGLEVTNNKECGEAKKYKSFHVCGKIDVCEHSWGYGCEGESECSDGRFTKTAQSYSTLNGEDELGTVKV